jgi:hypothetical protein
MQTRDSFPTDGLKFKQSSFPLVKEDTKPDKESSCPMENVLLTTTRPLYAISKKKHLEFE